LEAEGVRAGRSTPPRWREGAGARSALGRSPPGRLAGPPQPSRASDVPGSWAIDRLDELGKEVASLRAGLRTARDESREAREARDDAERRARTLAERVRELEGRAEMAESNLRTLLAAARGAGRDHVGDTEMEAILGVLKGGEGEEGDAGNAGAAVPAGS
jgi:hypothetical protein